MPHGYYGTTAPVAENGSLIVIDDEDNEMVGTISTLRGSGTPFYIVQHPIHRMVLIDRLCVAR